MVTDWMLYPEDQEQGQDMGWSHLGNVVLVQ